MSYLHAANPSRANALLILEVNVLQISFANLLRHSVIGKYNEFAGFAGYSVFFMVLPL
jgi:hypothetical protein